MKKQLIALALTMFSFAANSVEDWTITSAESSRTFTILPNTARAVNHPTVSYVLVVAEFRDTPTAKAERFKIAVTGCSKIESGGNILFASFDEKTIHRKEDWIENGGRVYDALAVGACNAYGLTIGTYELPPKPSKPSKPSKPGLI